jgi:anti-sigma B factor antagonist
MTPDFRVETEGDGGQCRISVSGELDMNSSPQLLQAIRKAIPQSSALEIRLQGVDYVDSSGIAVLVQGYKLAHKQGVEFAIYDPSPQVLAVIELSQLQQFFTIRGPE